MLWGTLGEPAATATAQINLERTVGSITLRHATYSAGAQVPLHRHDFPSIAYGVGGPCIETNARSDRISRRRLTYLPAGYAHSLNYVGATQVFVAELHSSVDEAPTLGDGGGAVALPASLYDLVWDMLVALRSADDGLLAPAVDRFWAKSAAYLGTRHPAWLPGLLDRLHEHWEVQPSAAALARGLGFSPQYLCRAFKRALGLTLKQYNQALRLDYARGLLWGSGRDISEIAAITGFADQSHLTRVLRLRSGRTPVTLRSTSFAPGVPLRHRYGSK